MKAPFCAVLLSLALIPLVAVEVAVTNTNDAGPGSLRDAIDQANASAPDSKIAFNIPGPGVHVIQPLKALPDITNSMVIDGYTQPGASQNTLSQGDDAVIAIQINTNLVVRQSVLIRGLAIPSIALNADNAELRGNFIGVDASGTKKLPNNYGIYLSSSFSHQIGGTQPADRNLIASDSQAIAGFGAPNPFGPSPDFTRIQGNYIGTDRSGTASIGAKGIGIAIVEMLQIIGGTEPGAGNVIAFNAGGAGVRVGGRAKWVSVLGNSIFSNGGPGIEGGDPGPNITKADIGSTQVQGSFSGSANTEYRIEIFSNHSCDPSGFGEGETFLGFATMKTDPAGNGTFSATLSRALAVGDVLTATATSSNVMTDPNRVNTSMFSHCVVAGPPVDLGIVATSQNPVVALSNALFTVTITNNSPSAASGIFVTVPLPKNAQFAPGASGWSNDFSKATFFLPSLAPNSAASTTFVLQFSQVGLAKTSFEIVADQIDVNQSNNRATVGSTVVNAAPRTFIVTNTAESGPGSFDQAVFDAQRGVGGDTIAFNIPGSGVHKISGTFYNIYKPLTIDGYTQPGSSPNTLANGNNSVLLIDFGAGFLSLSGGSSTVRGLVLPGIYLSGTSGLEGGHNVVEGCFIGTDPTGRAANTNLNINGDTVGAGVDIRGADDTRIGGPSPASRNIISANHVPNDAAAAVRTDAADTVIQGNYIGTDVTGSAPLGNAGAGIFFFGNLQAGGLVGGTNPGEGNVIAFNQGPGVVIGTGAHDVSVLGNSIYNNDGIGISVAARSASISNTPRTNAPNGLLSAPIITNVGTGPNLTRVQGAIQGSSSQTYRLEFFSSPSNVKAFFQSEGKTYLGSVNLTTDATGRGLFDVNFAVNSELVSATATDFEGNTSSFFTFTPTSSRCFQPGDLFVGFSQDGHLQWRASDGRPLSILLERGSDTIPTLEFGRDGTLWAADSAAGTLERFDTCGNRLTPLVIGAGSVPASITFDAAGNTYVGLQQVLTNFLKYDAAGHLLATYTVESTASGVLSAELASDQSTLFYTSSGTSIRRFDLAANQPLPPLATNLLSVFSLRLLPDGGLIVGDFGRLLRYDVLGNPVWTNKTQNKVWFKLKPDPDGRTFWASGQTNVTRFDLATGAVVQSVAVDTKNHSYGLAIVGEYTPWTSGSSNALPLLQISRNGDQVKLSWSNSFADFSLQTTFALGGTANWQNVASSPTVVNDQNAISINLGARTQFFRLVKP